MRPRGLYSGLQYLGHKVTAEGISPLPNRVAAIKKFPQQATVQQLQTYLGMLNFYRHFIKGAACVLKPLTDALRESQWTKLDWTAEMLVAFNTSRALLSNITQLAHTHPTAELVLAVDASSTHVGAVLQPHAGTSGLQPLSFFSCKLDSNQLKYSAFDRELLAAYLAIRHFQWALEGRHLVLESDHKPLSFALHRLSDAWTPRQQRQLSFIAEFTSEIKHVAGCDNVVAETLSRPAVAVLPAEGEHMDLVEMAHAQQLCGETQQLRSRLNVQTVLTGRVELYCDCSDGMLRPLVPVAWRGAVFNSVHNLAA